LISDGALISDGTTASSAHALVNGDNTPSM